MRCKHCGEEVGKYFSELDEHLWVKHREIIMKFLGKQRMLEDKRCGTCKSWSRGGLGAGRGGGYCLRYNIPKIPRNYVTTEGNNCWEPKRKSL